MSQSDKKPKVDKSRNQPAAKLRIIKAEPPSEPKKKTQSALVKMMEDYCQKLDEDIDFIMNL